MQEVFEKIKERLEEKKSKYQNLADSSNFDGWHEEDIKYTAKADMCEEIIEIVNQVAEEYNQSLANNNQLLTNNGWIPVSSGNLPEEGQVVNATLLIEEQQRRIVTQIMYDYIWLKGIKRMIAWKPLEEPYEGE